MAGGGSSELQAMRQMVREMGSSLRALDGRLVEQSRALQDLARQLAQVTKALAQRSEGVGPADASRVPVAGAAAKPVVSSRSGRSRVAAGQGRKAGA